MKSTSSLTEHQKVALQQYANLLPEYKKLSQELKTYITSQLKTAGIEYVQIVQRTKTKRSFREKMVRKLYKNAFADMKDICAIRIVCSFPGDVEKVEDVLKDNFDILESKDHEKSQCPHKFWYRSHHFKALLSDKHVSKKQYKHLKHFAAEIQVRTVFMDGWALLEHKINYKHEWNTSPVIKRKLSRLSALLELADEQLEELATTCKL